MLLACAATYVSAASTSCKHLHNSHTSWPRPVIFAHDDWGLDQRLAFITSMMWWGCCGMQGSIHGAMEMLQADTQDMSALWSRHIHAHLIPIIMFHINLLLIPRCSALLAKYIGIFWVVIWHCTGNCMQTNSTHFHFSRNCVYQNQSRGWFAPGYPSLYNDHAITTRLISWTFLPEDSLFFCYYSHHYIPLSHVILCNLKVGMGLQQSH